MSGPWTVVANHFEELTGISMAWERVRKIVSECRSKVETNAATVDYQSGCRSDVQTSEVRSASERLARKWGEWEEDHAAMKSSDVKKRARIETNDKEVRNYCCTCLVPQQRRIKPTSTKSCLCGGLG